MNKIKSKLFFLNKNAQQYWHVRIKRLGYFNSLSRPRLTSFLYLWVSISHRLIWVLNENYVWRIHNFLLNNEREMHWTWSREIRTYLSKLILHMSMTKTHSSGLHLAAALSMKFSVTECSSLMFSIGQSMVRMNFVLLSSQPCPA